MTYPNKREWPLTLADRHGVWCAYCLGYISSQEYMERHHQIGQTFLKQNFRKPLSGGWTVPVHAKDCHRKEIQRFASARESRLVVLETDGFDVSQAEPLAQKLHDRGDYQGATLIKERIIQWLGEQGEKDSHKRMEMITYQVASAAGIRGSIGIWIPESKITDAGYFFHRANQFSNQHRETQARVYLKRAEELAKISRAPDHIKLQQLLRRIQVGRELAAVPESLVASAGREYSRNTATVLAAFLHLELGDYKRARDCFEELLNKQNLSWLYRAEAYFGLGCLTLVRATRRPEFERAFQQLEAAQYIYVFLGVQGTPHPRIPISRGRWIEADSDGGILLPGHLLRRAPGFERLSRDCCFALRSEEFSRQKLRKKLLDVLLMN